MTIFEPASDPDQGPVLERLVGVKSKVARPERPWGFYIGILVIAVIAVAVFSAMNRSRGAHAAVRPSQSSPPPPIMPPRAAGPSVISAQPPPLLMPSPPQQLAPAPARDDPAVHWRAPSLIVDIGEDASPASAGAPGTGAAPATRPAASGDAKPSSDDRFGEHFGAGDTAVATRLSDTGLIVPQGAVAPAILETAINSDLPGFVRAVVSRDVRGFDGSTVLIPRGSKLIGQYKSGVAAGQSRAFVIWSRLITPTGVSVDLGSPAADRLGRGGLEGETNSHFFQRFGGSMLLSVLTAGLDTIGSHGSGGGAIVIASPQQATNIASIALQKRIDIPDTITVPQGAPIRVFIARDLDFSAVMRKAP